MSELWVTCPKCGKRQFPVTSGATIQNQFFKCKGSCCKQIFEVDTSSGKGIKKFSAK